MRYRPKDVFQILMLLSMDPETMSDPSGEVAIDVTPESCAAYRPAMSTIFSIFFSAVLIASCAALNAVSVSHRFSQAKDKELIASGTSQRALIPSSGYITIYQVSIQSRRMCSLHAPKAINCFSCRDTKEASSGRLSKPLMIALEIS